MNLSVLSFSFISACASASVQNQDRLVSCIDSPAEYPARSAELDAVYIADQADREGSIDQIDWPVVNRRDLSRRARVAEIFAEGCFKEAGDYANAAMIYQHGQTADHVFQTFVWAKKAVELGDKKSKWLMAAGLDRYLVRIGNKQLFATQTAKSDSSSCWCLELTEPSVPKKMQINYTQKSVDDQMRWIKTLNADQPKCRNVQLCDHPLRPSPKGTVPGFW